MHFKIQSFSIHLANSFLVALLQGCKNLCCVGFCVYLGEYVGNHPVFVYHKGGADNSHISLATHLLLAPSTKGLDGGGFHVGKQVEGQFKLFPELGGEAVLSLLIPKTTAPLARISSYTSRKPQASVVQPGVLSLG